MEFRKKRGTRANSKLQCTKKIFERTGFLLLKRKVNLMVDTRGLHQRKKRGSDKVAGAWRSKGTGGGS